MKIAANSSPLMCQTARLSILTDVNEFSLTKLHGQLLASHPTDVQMELEIKSRFEPDLLRPTTQEAEAGGLKDLGLAGRAGVHL